mgnify:CR=1 FL=1
MKFDELDAKMRVYETMNDLGVLPGMYIVARIDGRGFTKLTKEKHPFEAPFDSRFRDYMVETVRHLMNCGFKVVYGYTQSDEISLLFDLNETAFSRKIRKWNSILAAEASAKFSLLLGDLATFDCRLCQLPNKALVVDYFRWRNEDAHRNSLNAYCYWLMRKNGENRSVATKRIEGLSVAEKNELLFGYEINFNDVPLWQKRGIGMYWQIQIREVYNPVKQEKVETERREIFINYELPMKEEYSEFISVLI